MRWQVIHGSCWEIPAVKRKMHVSNDLRILVPHVGYGFFSVTVTTQGMRLIRALHLAASVAGVWVAVGV